ncbi:VOC family protein [Mycobacterium ulcerans]|uniref:VOC family protein n=1 Tax=Mycobacterium ulcerans TaxID=1809 RepID=UPI00106B5A29|nr:VOC family protein [Mycobacterium ulcerans]
MRWRGVHHVEFNVLDYDKSIAFYDAMFGWLGYMSFWTLDIEYRSTYYMARFPLPHSYIGIQPADGGGQLRHRDQKVGINHIALWARSRAEIDRFHRDFLLPRAIPVTDPPREYPIYTPGYYAVFFDDPINGIHWELARLPSVPSPRDFWKSHRTLRAVSADHPEWKRSVAREAMRSLPGRTSR